MLPPSKRILWERLHEFSSKSDKHGLALSWVPSMQHDIDITIWSKTLHVSVHSQPLLPLFTYCVYHQLLELLGAVLSCIAFMACSRYHHPLAPLCAACAVLPFVRRVQQVSPASGAPLYCSRSMVTGLTSVLLELVLEVFESVELHTKEN